MNKHVLTREEFLNESLDPAKKFGVWYSNNRDVCKNEYTKYFSDEKEAKEYAKSLVDTVIGKDERVEVYQRDIIGAYSDIKYTNKKRNRVKKINPW